MKARPEANKRHRQALPELPEVETTRRGILPHIRDRRIVGVSLRQARLRWPVPANLPELLRQQSFTDVQRRGKYLLLRARTGTLMIHLGMSGSLRILSTPTAARKHDHVDIIFQGDRIMRYTDPRRFGCILWLPGPVPRHRLLDSLGPEPLADGFDGLYLYRLSRKRKAPIKSFIMDSRVVVGVGNIYANEALFLAGIHPLRAAGRVSLARYERLAETIRQVLHRAIDAGGTTLRDFTDSEGKPGYFSQCLFVYGHSGSPCKTCGRDLRETRLGGRSTVYCPDCQR